MHRAGKAQYRWSRLNSNVRRRKDQRLYATTAEAKNAMQDLRSPLRATKQGIVGSGWPSAAELLNPQFGASARRPEVSRTDPSLWKVRSQLRRARSSARVSQNHNWRFAPPCSAPGSQFVVPPPGKQVWLLRADHAAAERQSRSVALEAPGVQGAATEFKVFVVAEAESPRIPPTTTPNPSFEARPNGIAPCPRGAGGT